MRGIMIAKRWIACALMMVLGLTACAPQQPAKPGVTHPSLTNLTGQWVQFVPVNTLPERLTLDAGGHAQTDKDSGTWRLVNEKLMVRLGGRETAYDFTVSSYMLTLVNNSTGDSSFYIDPNLFAQQGDDNAKFTGQWAAFSTYGMLNFDGQGTLQDIYYDQSAGKSTRTLKYTARDGILQAVDDAGNVIYNLYSFADGTMRLGETSEYDSDLKQWTVYWKKSEPSALLAKWTRLIDQTGTDGMALPQVVELKSDGKATVTRAGGSPVDAAWEYYEGGFLLLRLSDMDIQYAYASPDGPVLMLDNGDEARSWYTTDSFRNALKAPKELAGKWTSEEPALTLEAEEDGTMTFTLGDKSYPASATAAGGILVLRHNNQTYYIAYQADDFTLSLAYKSAPFLPADIQTVTLTKE